MMKRLLPIMLLSLCLFVLNVFVVVVHSQEIELPPLTEPGLYGVRLTKMTFVDESREDWELETYVWYPAVKPADAAPAQSVELLKDAPPDMSGAPYPLILYSHGWTAGSFELADVKAHLASQGYVVAAPQHHDTDPELYELVDRYLDILTVLDGLTDINEGELAGMIDLDKVGLMGYSLGAHASLQTLGLMSDPAHLEHWCAEHPDITTWDCRWVPLLDGIASYRTKLGLEDTPSGRWSPNGHDRVHAVLAMAPCMFPLTAEDMLVAVTTPTMMMHGTLDPICDYAGNAVRTYTHLGTEDRYLITVVDGGHGAFQTNFVPMHFATGFFGYYLRGEENYAPYLAPDGLPTVRRTKLVWGPYEEE